MHTRSVVVGSHKLVVNARGVATAYDLNADPGERHAATLTESDRRALEDAMAATTQRAARHAGQARTASLDEQTRENMRALGYAP